MEGQDLQEPHLQQPHKDIPLITDFIKEKARDVDYAAMITQKTRVLALGETHTRPEQKDELINHLKDLKDLGFTHLGMEIFGTNLQEIIDGYYEGRYTRDEFRRLIPYDEVYFNIVDKAKELGIRVVGIEIPTPEMEKFDRDMNKLIEEGKIADYLKFIDERDRQRDRWMAKTVQKILDADPNNKVVIYSGSGHSELKKGTMAGLLVKAGIDLISVNMIGGKKEGIGERYGLLATKLGALGEIDIEEEVRNAGSGNRRFMMPALRRQALINGAFKNADWIIHLPQAEEDMSYENKLVSFSERVLARAKK